MSNRNFGASGRVSQNHRSNNNNNNSTTELDRHKLPAINNGYISQVANNYSTHVSNLNKTDNNTPKTNTMSNSTPYASANNKTNCLPHGVTSSQTFSSLPLTSGMYNSMQTAPANRSWSSNRFVGLEKTNGSDVDVEKTVLINQNNNSPARPMTSVPGSFNRPSSNNRNMQHGQKTVLYDRQLANEILQKAGIPSSSTRNDCLEVITDAPVTMNDNVNCDPNPLCMKKPSDCQVNRNGS